MIEFGCGQPAQTCSFASLGERVKLLESKRRDAGNAGPVLAVTHLQGDGLTGGGEGIRSSVNGGRRIWERKWPASELQ